MSYVKINNELTFAITGLKQELSDRAKYTMSSIPFQRSLRVITEFEALQESNITFQEIVKYINNNTINSFEVYDDKDVLIVSFSDIGILEDATIDYLAEYEPAISFIFSFIDQVD